MGQKFNNQTSKSRENSISKPQAYVKTGNLTFGQQLVTVSHMSAALTSYWQAFIKQMVESGRYNNRSEVIRAGLRSLEEQELAREEREFERVFAGGKTGEPAGKTINRMVARQKAHRKGR